MNAKDRIRSTVLKTSAALLLATASGCQQMTGNPFTLFGLLDASKASPYQTVVEAPNRDSELASRLNAEGLDLIEAERYDAAEKKLKEALSADITFGPAHNNLGLVYYQQKQLYKAAWEFEYAAKLMPRSPEPKNNLGLILEKVGKLDDAVDQFEAAVKIEPDNPHVIGNLARARVRRGNKDEKTKDLLRQIVMKDQRPNWIRWAKDKLGLMGEAVDPND